jgi:hypothetical protein
MLKRNMSALAVCLAFAGGAYATPFYINAGSFGTTTGAGGSDTNTITNSMESLGWIDSVATSIYFGLTPGSTVIDTNNIGYMGTLGIPPYTNPEGRQVTTLKATGSLGDSEGFTSTPSEWGESFRGGARWGMTYTYTLVGAINGAGTGVNFNSGYFDLFHEDGTNSTQVARLNLSNFGLVSGAGATYTVLASGSFSYDWTGAGGLPDGLSDATPFAQNFFIDVNSGSRYYDLWSSGAAANPMLISWRMDNNIDCPVGQPDCSGVPLPSQLTTIFDASGDPIGGYRQTLIDGTVRFNVPEPGTLALLGLGLLGLGIGRRYRKATD